jgi:lysine-N-methylase
MVERARQLQCAFLDDDQLCAVQKKHGHSALPAACQAFPFGFMQDEEKRPVAQLSRYCPSIRENYGEPIARVLASKLTQAGGAKPLTVRMGLKSGRTLPQEQYLLLAAAWREVLRGNVAAAVLRAYHLTDRFDELLPSSSSSRAEAEAALTKARDASAPELVRAKRPSFSARLLFALVLGGLSYPVRVILDSAVRRPGTLTRWRAAWTKLQWFLGLGRVDLLHVERPVALGRIDDVAPFLDAPAAEPIHAYLRELIDRRQLFARQTYLARALVELGLAVTVISRYARARASAEGLTAVRPSDVAEGIGVAELTLSHQSAEREGYVLSQLRLKLMSDPDAFRQLLASEA